MGKSEKMTVNPLEIDIYQNYNDLAFLSRTQILPEGGRVESPGLQKVGRILWGPVPNNH